MKTVIENKQEWFVDWHKNVLRRACATQTIET